MSANSHPTQKKSLLVIPAHEIILPTQLCLRSGFREHGSLMTESHGIMCRKMTATLQTNPSISSCLRPIPSFKSDTITKKRQSVRLVESLCKPSRKVCSWRPPIENFQRQPSSWPSSTNTYGNLSGQGKDIPDPLHAGNRYSLNLNYITRTKEVGLH